MYWKSIQFHDLNSVEMLSCVNNGGLSDGEFPPHPRQKVILQSDPSHGEGKPTPAVPAELDQYIQEINSGLSASEPNEYVWFGPDSLNNHSMWQLLLLLLLRMCS